MDENNGQKNAVQQVADKVKDEAKNKAKKSIMQAIKPMLPGILSAVGIFFLCLLAVGVINLIPYLIKDFFSSIFGGLFGGSSTNSESQSEDSLRVLESVVYIDDNGYYKLKDENLAEKILEELKAQQVDTKEAGFDEDEFGNMIDKYIQAEVKTSLPKTGKSSKLDGTITIRRASTSTGNNAQNLTYISSGNFNKKIANGDSDIYNYFSIDPDTFDVWIATAKDSTQSYKLATDTTAAEPTGGGIAKKIIKYEKYIKNYTVPLNFFLTMHLISQDMDFMNELLDMIGENEVVLTYVDSSQTYTTTYTYEGEYYRKIHFVRPEEERNYDVNRINRQMPIKVSEIIYNSIEECETNPRVIIGNNNVKNYTDKSQEYQKIVSTYHSGYLCVTYSNTWLKKSSKTVSELDNSSEEPNIKETELEYEYKNLLREINNDTSTEYPYTLMEDKKDFYIKETYKHEIQKKKYTVTDGESEITVDDFVELIKKYPKVRNNIETSPSNIFYMLEQNENTQNLEKIMRVVVYKLNDIDYGITEADLEYLLADYYYSSSGIYGNTIVEKVWYSLRALGYSEYAVAGVMGNISAESGFRANNSEDGEGNLNKIGYTDEEYTEMIDNNEYTIDQFITDGVGYGLCQWTNSGRKEGLYLFAKDRGVSISDEDMQLEYLIGELTHSGGANGKAAYCLNEDDSVRFGYTADDWINAESPEDAAIAFCWAFEGPRGTPEDHYDRNAPARHYYEEFHGKTGGAFIQNTTDSRVKGYYTSSRTGRTFTVLDQNCIDDWYDKCNRAACTIIASGYSDDDADSLINIMNTTYQSEKEAKKYDPIIPTTYFPKYGLEITMEHIGRLEVTEYSELLKNQLISGGYAMVWLNINPNSANRRSISRQKELLDK